MKLPTFATAISMTVVAAMGLAATPPVKAQSVQPVVVQASPPSTSPTPSFSDTELRTFAAAVLDVQRVSQTYTPRLKGATIEDQQKIEETASAEMTRAVENRGMTATRFSQILELTKVSPELADRVRWHIHQSASFASYRPAD